MCLRCLIKQLEACLDTQPVALGSLLTLLIVKPKITHKYSLMERNNCVGVISYKELEIAMQRKSVVKAWNTEHSKQKKWPPLQHPNDLNLPWGGISEKKKKLENLCLPPPNSFSSWFFFSKIAVL